MSIYLTSQHRTRRRKRRTSDCFFFCNSSTYLRAPICEFKSQLGVVEGVESMKFSGLAILNHACFEGNSNIKLHSFKVSLICAEGLTDLDCEDGLSIVDFVVEFGVGDFSKFRCVRSTLSDLARKVSDLLSNHNFF
jgi:hypothetical protein